MSCYDLQNGGHFWGQLADSALFLLLVSSQHLCGGEAFLISTMLESVHISEGFKYHLVCFGLSVIVQNVTASFIDILNLLKQL